MMMMNLGYYAQLNICVSSMHKGRCNSTF